MAPYELLYHPTIPGRGEYIRLALEATSTPYTDPANASPSGYTSTVLPRLAAATPPIFAPPALHIPELNTTVAQTPNILAYLAPRIGLAPADEPGRLAVQALVLTALDWSNEAHDTHHPVAPGAYYEEQRAESLRKAADFRSARVPKFLGYFERVLAANGDAPTAGRYLVGGALSAADTTLWQVLDGLKYAFPREMAARAGEFPLVLGVFYEGVREEPGIKAYLASGRRLPYSNGLFRHYSELDRE